MDAGTWLWSYVRSRPAGQASEHWGANEGDKGGSEGPSWTVVRLCLQVGGGCRAQGVE